MTRGAKGKVQAIVSEIHRQPPPFHPIHVSFVFSPISVIKQTSD